MQMQLEHRRCGTTSQMWVLVPRAIYFKLGIAIGTHNHGKHDDMQVMNLPTEHYDFIGPVQVLGRTAWQIEREAAALTQALGIK